MNSFKSDIKRILFVTNCPLTSWGYQRFGVDLLKKNGFAVTIWSCYAYSPEAAPTLLPNELSFTKLRDLEKALEELSAETMIVPLFFYNHDSLRIFRAIARSDAFLTLLGVNAIPLPTFRAQLLTMSKIISVIKSPNIIPRLLGRLPESMLGVRPATVFLAGGEESLHAAAHRPMDSSTHILWAHTLDYDTYLASRDQPMMQNPSQAVFLDDYTPFHPDNDVLHMTPPATAEQYYPVLNRFFDLLEKQLRVKVVIAAHPRADYRNKPDFYEGRPLYYNKTHDLIRASSFAMTHFSTAIDFAVLYEKPLLFLTTELLNKHNWYGICIRYFAEWFGKKPIFVDKDTNIPWNDELKIEVDRYEKYKRLFIKKPGSPDEPCWQIFSNNLKAHQSEIITVSV